MVPDPQKTSLGLEYFVQENDDLWSASDAELVELGKRECERLGFFDASEVSDGAVERMQKAYPVYTGEWKEGLATIRAHLETLPNLQLVGRNGQHRYNNQDHSMVTAMYAARNIAGANYDVWDVNVDSAYHEEVTEADKTQGDRLSPTRVSREVGVELLRDIFALYDPVALGGAVSTIAGLSLFLVTALLIIEGGEPLGPNLSLLGNYFLGFTVSWQGAFLGLFEGGLGGFGFGYVLARLINLVISWQKTSLIHRIEAQSIDPLT